MTTQTHLSLIQSLETWRRYGAYSVGIIGVSRKFPGVPFSAVRPVMAGSVGFGGFAAETIEANWNKGQTA